MFVGNASAASKYYIDFATGSDGNAGTSKAAPWKCHPFMRCFAGSYTHQPGDQFIFKGGVAWLASSFPMVVATGGSADNNRDYYGVDMSWFTGASWTRPIFDYQSTCPGDCRPFYINAGPGWITVDNLEIKNLFINSAQGTFLHSLIAVFGVSNVTVKNCFIHDWTTNSTIYDHMGGATAAGNYTGLVLDHVTISNANSSKFLGAAVYGWDTVQFSTIKDAVQGVFGADVAVHDNDISDIVVSTDPVAHCNVLQVSGPSTQVYNNYVHDNGCSGVTIYVVPNGSGNGKSSVYNNVLWNNSAIPIQWDARENAGVLDGEAYNNTSVSGGSGACIRAPVTTPNMRNITLKNNQCITDGVTDDDIPSGSFSGTFSFSNEVKMSTATAKSQGYTIANQFAPTLSTGSTVGAGLNLASLALPNLNFDIKGAARPPIAWDAGAYQFGGASRPAPSSGLVAVVQ